MVGAKPRKKGGRLLVAAILLAIPFAVPSPVSGSVVRAPAALRFGIKVTGNDLTSLAGGPPVRLLGVDRASAERMCVQSGSTAVFQGPTNAASIQAIQSWHANAVRIPLNEDCWLGINGAPRELSGANYQHAIESYVSAFTAAGMYVILDLHWSAPGAILANQQWPMADADHSPAFWRSVAHAFKSDRAVIFDLFNEPFITSWPCWKDGCATTFTDKSGQTVTYRTAGMQQLVDAVRSIGAHNPIMLGGLNYATDESAWAAYRPTDPDNQLIVSFHTYRTTACNTQSCWNSTIAPLAKTMPVVTGEFGESDCADTYALAYMTWADANGISYLAWAWYAIGRGLSCATNYCLTIDYSGAPSPYGRGLHTHLAALASAQTTSKSRAGLPLASNAVLTDRTLLAYPALTHSRASP
jgi:hypothetical protein